MAKRLIDAARQSGADAVKFQSFIAEDLVTAQAPKATYQIQNTGTQESQQAMLKALELSFDKQTGLKAHCEKVGILFLSTPFEDKSLAFLAQLGVPLFKIGSTDTTNIPFLRKAARYGKPVILSTGMSDMAEVEEAAAALRAEGLEQFVLLQCTTNYPAQPEEVHLRAMQTIRERCRALVGYSDHTTGLLAATCAVAMGAVVIEKHFTLSRALPGPDHKASLEPQELTELVQRIRETEKILGSADKRPSTAELSVRRIAQKSVVAARTIPEGKVLDQDDLTCKRPSEGIRPRELPNLIGQKATRTIAKDELLIPGDVSGATRVKK